MPRQRTPSGSTPRDRSPIPPIFGAPPPNSSLSVPDPRQRQVPAQPEEKERSTLEPARGCRSTARSRNSALLAAGGGTVEVAAEFRPQGQHGRKQRSHTLPHT